MKYEVQIPEIGYQWKADSQHDTYEEAKNRALEIVGSNDYYSEPHEESKFVTPEPPFIWNGYIYENKLTGEKKDSHYEKLFKLDEGYFGKKGSDDWSCRITVIN